MTRTYRDDKAFVSLLALCRQLRQNSTNAEAMLWHLLRGRQVAGAKFRRQHQFGVYVLDFYCAEHRLCVELDGGQHFAPDGVERDEVRSAYLDLRAVRVLRFTNVEVLRETERVLETIWQVIGERAISPSP